MMEADASQHEAGGRPHEARRWRACAPRLTHRLYDALYDIPGQRQSARASDAAPITRENQRPPAAAGGPACTPEQEVAFESRRAHSGSGAVLNLDQESPGSSPRGTTPMVEVP